jgi:hypothetical protein
MGRGNKQPVAGVCGTLQATLTYLRLLLIHPPPQSTNVLPHPSNNSSINSNTLFCTSVLACKRRKK